MTVPVSLQGTPADPSLALQRSLRAQSKRPLDPSSSTGGGSADGNGNGSGSGSSTSTKTCDACRRRRVKCDRVLPRCGRCVELALRCTHDDVLMRRGPPRREEREAFERAGIVYQTERERRRERKERKEAAKRAAAAAAAGSEGAAGAAAAAASGSGSGSGKGKGSAAAAAAAAGSGGAVAPSNFPSAAKKKKTEQQQQQQQQRSVSIGTRTPETDGGGGGGGGGSASASATALPSASAAAAPGPSNYRPIPPHHAGAPLGGPYDAHGLLHRQAQQPSGNGNGNGNANGNANGTANGNGGENGIAKDSLWMQVMAPVDASDALGPFFNHRAGRRPMHLGGPSPSAPAAAAAGGVEGSPMQASLSQQFPQSAAAHAMNGGINGNAPNANGNGNAGAGQAEALPAIEEMLWNLSANEAAGGDDFSLGGAGGGGGGDGGHGLQQHRGSSYAPPTMLDTSFSLLPNGHGGGSGDGMRNGTPTKSPTTGFGSGSFSRFPSNTASSAAMSSGLSNSLPLPSTASSSNLNHFPPPSPSTHLPPLAQGSDRRRSATASSQDSGGSSAAQLQLLRKSSPDDERLQALPAPTEVLVDLLREYKTGTRMVPALPAESPYAKLALGQSIESLGVWMQNAERVSLALDERGVVQAVRTSEYFASVLQCQRRPWTAVGPAGATLAPQWDKFASLEYQRGIVYPQASFVESDYDALRAEAGRMIDNPCMAALLAEFAEHHHQTALVVPMEQLLGYYDHLVSIANGEETDWSDVQVRLRQALVISAAMMGTWTLPGITLTTSGSGASARCVTWEFGYAATKLAYALCCPRNITHDDEECCMDLLFAYHLWSNTSVLGPLDRAPRFSALITPLSRRLGAFDPARCPMHLTPVDREMLKRQSWRYLQAKVLVMLWTSLRWPENELIQNDEVRSLGECSGSCICSRFLGWQCGQSLTAYTTHHQRFPLLCPASSSRKARTLPSNPSSSTSTSSSCFSSCTRSSARRSPRSPGSRTPARTRARGRWSSSSARASSRICTSGPVPRAVCVRRRSTAPHPPRRPKGSWTSSAGRSAHLRLLQHDSHSPPRRLARRALPRQGPPQLYPGRPCRTRYHCPTAARPADAVL